MADADRCRRRDWVEVERVLLEPPERSPNLPSDTAEQPLLTWVKGFAQDEAALGEELTVETMTGRLVVGRLSSTTPGYYHTFGDSIAELSHVGRDLRARLATYREGRPHQGEDTKSERPEDGAR